MSKVLCKEYFNGFLRDTNFKNMQTLYDVPLHPYQLSGTEVIIVPPTMIATTKPAGGKLEPQHGSIYKSILEKCSFNILELLIDFSKDENKIPKSLRSLVGATKLRSTRVDNSFMHHFIILCMWKPMKDGKCWITTSDLDPQKNLNNVEEFKRNVNYLCDNNIFCRDTY